MREDESRQYPVREDMRYQFVWWTMERIAWTLLALVPLAGLAGVFAHGWLSDVTLQAPDSRLVLRYERFQRQTALSHFVAYIPGKEPGEVRLRLGPSFQQAYEIEDMQPQPARSSASAQGLDLIFHAPESGDLVAVIWARPRQFGLVELQAGANGGKAADFKVFIYP